MLGMKLLPCTNQNCILSGPWEVIVESETLPSRHSKCNTPFGAVEKTHPVVRRLLGKIQKASAKLRANILYHSAMLEERVTSTEERIKRLEEEKKAEIEAMEQRFRD